MAAVLSAHCCIVGGGPAGMMLGFLLARAGVDVAILEKHGDFLRDFRGDTVHPSTLQIMHELGLLDAFLQRPHTKIRGIAAQVGPFPVTVGDFSHLPTVCKFIALVPQWDFLDFLAEHAKAFPGFRLLMHTEGIDLIRDSDRIAGVRARGPDGEMRIAANLVVAADGRHSTLRDRAGLKSIAFGAPIDVLWFRLSKQEHDPEQVAGRVDAGRMLVMIDRGAYWQCAFLIPKGGFDALRREPIESFRDRISDLAPDLRDRLPELTSWDDVKLLTVVVDRLETWHLPGLLCIGDAAHAMSPIGGVGINLAIQDAVASANILAEPLRNGETAALPLAAVQRRREFPVRVIQRVQVLVQNRILARVLGSRNRITRLPLPLRLVRAVPALQRIPARLFGLGIRPEHVRLPSPPAGGRAG